jgi:oligopeptide transport system permease protein
MDGITSYPHRLLSAAIWISLIILSFNLLGDGLRDAFDPKLKKDKS